MLVRKVKVPLPTGYISRAIQLWKLPAGILLLYKRKELEDAGNTKPQRRERETKSWACGSAHLTLDCFLRLILPSSRKPLRAKFSFPGKESVARVSLLRSLVLLAFQNS